MILNLPNFIYALTGGSRISGLQLEDIRSALGGAEGVEPTSVSVGNIDIDMDNLEHIFNGAVLGEGGTPTYIIGALLNTINNATVPANSFQTGQETVNDSATALDPALASKGVLLFSNVTNTGTIYIGNSVGVTASTGFPIEPGASMSLGVSNANEVFTVVASGTTETLSYLVV